MDRMLKHNFNFGPNLPRNKFCDAKVRAKDSTRLVPIHRVILAAVSKKFEKIFEEQPDTDIYMISEVKFATMNKIVEYIYSGEALFANEGDFWVGLVLLSINLGEVEVEDLKIKVDSKPLMEEYYETETEGCSLKLKVEESCDEISTSSSLLEWTNVHARHLPSEGQNSPISINKENLAGQANQIDADVCPSTMIINVDDVVVTDTTTEEDVAREVVVEQAALGKIKELSPSEVETHDSLTGDGTITLSNEMVNSKYEMDNSIEASKNIHQRKVCKMAGNLTPSKRKVSRLADSSPSSKRKESKLPEDLTPSQRKEQPFNYILNKESSEIELDSSFEFNKIADDGKESLVVDEVRTRRPSLKIRLQKNAENEKEEILKGKSTKKDKMELKLSVLGEKRRKRKCSDEEYTPTRVKSRREPKAKKMGGRTVTRSRTRDVVVYGVRAEDIQFCKTKNPISAATSVKGDAKDNSVENPPKGSKTENNDVNSDEDKFMTSNEVMDDKGNLLNGKGKGNGKSKGKIDFYTSSSDQVKPAESILDCLQKLCDEKDDEVAFSSSSVSTEAQDPRVTDVSPQLSDTKRNSATTKLPKFKERMHPTAPSRLLKKDTKLIKSKLKFHPCTHKHGGCRDVFSEKTELHKHARKCKHRPNTSFSCRHDGCLKRYYYKEDYEKHVAKFHPVASEAFPSTSTSSASIICTPTLHTCKECSLAFPSQQGLLDHTEKAHQLLPKVPCQIKE